MADFFHEFGFSALDWNRQLFAEDKLQGVCFCFTSCDLESLIIISVVPQIMFIEELSSYLINCCFPI